MFYGLKTSFVAFRKTKMLLSITTTLLFILLSITTTKQDDGAAVVDMRKDKSVNPIKKLIFVRCHSSCKNMYYNCILKYLNENNREPRKPGSVLNDLMVCYTRKMTCGQICHVVFKPKKPKK